MPMNAAEMKQFWYPMLSTQGVILEQTRVSKYPGKRPTQDCSNSPVTDSKRHSIPHQNHRGHRIPAQLPVTVNEVIDAQRDTGRIAQRREEHGYYQAEPVDVMCCADTPEDQRGRQDEHAQSEWP